MPAKHAAPKEPPKLPSSVAALLHGRPERSLELWFSNLVKDS